MASARAERAERVERGVRAELAALGCSDTHKIALAWHLYRHLVDTLLMYNVEYCYSREVDELFVVARQAKRDRINIYVPVSVSRTNITQKYISNLQLHLCTIESGPGINLAFIDSDSTTVIYNFTAGLPDVTDPAYLTRKRARSERRNLIDSELRKRRATILSDALDGGVVDDDDVMEVL